MSLTGQPIFKMITGNLRSSKGLDMIVLMHDDALLHAQHTKLSVNDPSAGSPTETLLRLLLSLDGQVWTSSQHSDATTRAASPTGPKASPNHPIDSSDGRCVQRAGT